MKLLARKHIETKLSTSILKSILGVSPVTKLASKSSKIEFTPRPGFATMSMPRKIDDSSLLGESGYSSLSESRNNSNSVSDDSNLSMFRSIMDSRKNSSLSLEQVVEKVSARKENRGSKPRSGFFTLTTRPRSHSASEVNLRTTTKPSKAQSKSPSQPSIFGGSKPSPPSRSHASECGSPTMEQAILMGCRDTIELDYGYGGSCSLASTSPDYNLEELVRAIRLKHGVLEPPPTPSPPDSSYRRSPLSLFGAESLQRPHYSQPGQATRRLKLPSISEDLVSRPSCSTPVEYYMSGFSPYSTSPHPISTQFSNISNSPSAVSAASLLSDRPKLSAMSIAMSTTNPSDSASLEASAKLHRSSASQNDANCTWSGQLPPRRHKNPVFSCKIFLGGVPWDVTESSLIQAFSQFGPIRIEWPGKDTSPSPPKGYVYIVFEEEEN